MRASTFLVEVISIEDILLAEPSKKNFPWRLRMERTFYSWHLNFAE
jgi:hypothetical protein